jgi:hypothetical protein
MYLCHLFKDEVLHFRRIRLLQYSVLFMPALAVAICILGQPARFAITQACMLASLGVGSTITASLVSDISGGMVMFFVNRSVPRWEILLSRIISGIAVVVLSIIISMFALSVTDYFTNLKSTHQSALSSLCLLALGTAQISICATLGVLIGTFSSSAGIAAGAFLVLGINIQALVVLSSEMIPKWFHISNQVSDIIVFLLVIPFVLGGLACAHFVLRRKPL